MKKLKTLVITISILFSNTLLFGQFEKGEFTLSAGISYFNYGYLNKTWNWNSDYKFNLIPPVVLKAEIGIHEYLGIGCFLGYSTKKYTLKSNNNFTQHYNYYSIGGIGSFHFTKLLEEHLDIGDLNLLDMYVSTTVRLEKRDYSSSYYYNSDFNRYTTYSDSDINLRFGFGLGMRYYFVENIAIFCEVGSNNLGYITMGGTLKL